MNDKELELQQKCDELTLEVNELKGKVNEMQELIRQSFDGIQTLVSYTELQKASIDKRKYEIMDMVLNGGCNFFFPKFRSNEETLDMIIKEGYSIGRYGDGEFALAYDIPRPKFQKPDAGLRERLREVLRNPIDNYLIGIAKNYGSLEDFGDEGAESIRHYMAGDTRRQHEALLKKDYVYSNAHVFNGRIEGRKDEISVECYNRYREIWRNKNIIIVEGASTRTGVGNDLLSGAGSIRRILAPATNSYDRYDDILKESLKYADTCDLFLLAIGPSSAVLAYDLTNSGYQAVDVGHMDLGYEWFTTGKTWTDPTPYKYNNYIDGGDRVLPVEDPKYYEETIASFF